MKSKRFVKKVKITYEPIEEVMNAASKKLCGLTKLSRGQLAALNEWLDRNAVLAPGDPPKIIK